VDRRDELSARRVQTVNRLHRLLTELIPGGAGKDLTATKAKRLLATVRPRSVVGKTTRRIAVEEIGHRRQAEDPDQGARHRGSGTGVAADGPARYRPRRRRPHPGRRRRHRRFPDRNHFASWTGTAPLDASSGEQIRHRLSRAGNRRLNHVLHMAAIAQIRLDTEGRTYYRRKLDEAKTRKEARRCLKRRLSDMVYRQLVADAKLAEPTAAAASEEDAGAGPGGHSGASLTSSAADLPTPVIGSSDQPQPEPASPTLPATRRPRTPRAASAPSPPRRRAGAVKVERPTGRTTLTATSTDAHSAVPKPRS
jgi:transposase